MTPETIRLLMHWRSHKFSSVRPFFCQVEAAETAIWLTEVAPNFGKAGSVAYILGNNLTGTTGVTFNGTPAVFNVISDSEIKAKVPSGATTGEIQVITPTSTLNSNVAFQVEP